MDGPLDANSLKNSLLAMGYQENLATIAVWKTSEMEKAVDLCEFIQNTWGQISPKEYYFNYLSSMGYPCEAVIMAIEKSSLNEAIDFLDNPPEESKAIPDNPAQNQRQPGRNLFSQMRGLLQNEAKKVGDFLNHLSNEVERVRNDLSAGGKVEKYAEQFLRDGMTFEDAFRELQRNFARRRRQRLPGNEELKEDGQYISGEPIIIDGVVVSPTSYLEILIILDNIIPQRGISERDKKKLRKIGYQLRMKPESCTVCMEDFEVNEQVYMLPCNHVFHQDCILEWLKRSTKCPLCNLNI
ncbi:unnamed protein product [Blepharisma stoltei]|uniref:RING-type domain-containing protein n=1 Tax=Blepharisma stoltei TaxID=1481888 RepID=A0AAU9JV39_9CILI|nr:unnamed protein product [Blepharisma stoltei]